MRNQNLVKFKLFHFHLFYDENATGWSENDRGGETQTFGHDILDKFLTDNNLKMVVRAHQTCQNGFNMRQDQKLVTVFSAPNYCQRDGNDGAVMVIESDGSYDFEILINSSNHRIQIEWTSLSKKMQG